jgi:hypothetical protein
MSRHHKLLYWLYCAKKGSCCAATIVSNLISYCSILYLLLLASGTLTSYPPTVFRASCWRNVLVVRIFMINLEIEFQVVAGRAVKCEKTLVF